MNNAQYNAKDIKDCCENKLSISFRTNNEFNGWFKLNDIKIVRITVPKGRKNVCRKTYGSMAKQLWLKISQFDNLLGCDLKYRDYVEIVERELIKRKKKNNFIILNYTLK